MADYSPGHATSQPVADDIEIGSADVFEDPHWSNGLDSLIDEEIEHFKQFGFVVKRGLIKEDQAFAEILDYVWSLVPRRLLQRNDPSSWFKGADQQWTETDRDRVGMLANGNWKARSRGDDGIGTEPVLVKLANHPGVTRLVRQFLGGDVMPVRRVRGIYLIFPEPEPSSARYGVHADYTAAHLSAMILIDDIPPRAGGFTVWPGTHKQLHPHWNTMHGSLIDDERRDAFRLARDEALRNTTPVELTGKPGDVVFWHPRLLHSAGINASATTDNPIVRSIVPCDYQRAGRDYFDDLEFGPGPNVQYWMDTRNFVGDITPTPDNLWEDWGFHQAPPSNSK